MNSLTIPRNTFSINNKGGDFRIVYHLIQAYFNIVNNIVSYVGLQCIISKYSVTFVKTLIWIEENKYQRHSITYEQQGELQLTNNTTSFRNVLDQISNPQLANTAQTAFAENILVHYYSYTERQSGCVVVFDFEQGMRERLQMNKKQEKAIRNNFDQKMTREKEFLDCLNHLLKQSNSKVITLEMLLEAAREADPDIRILFERSGSENSSVELGYVVLFPEDCRLFLHIPTIRGSLIHDKEQIYLEEYPRSNPHVVVKLGI